MAVSKIAQSGNTDRYMIYRHFLPIITFSKILGKDVLNYGKLRQSYLNGFEKL